MNGDSNAASAFSEPEIKLIKSVNGKPNDTLADRSQKLGQTIKSYMENVALVSKVEELLNDKKFASYTLQKTSEFSVQPVVEVKKEILVVKAEPVVAPVVAPAPVAEVPKPKVEEKPVVVAQPEKPAEIPTPVAEILVVKAEVPVVAATVVETPKESEVKPVEAKTETTPAVATTEVKEEKQPFNKSENRPDRPYKKQYRERNDGEKGGEPRGEHRGEYRPRGRGGYRGGENRDNREYRGPRDNRREEDNKSDTSLESSGEKAARQFNNKEVKELVEEGFQIVGKKDTRQKPKDPRDAQDYHRKQHGYREKKADR